MPFENGVNWLPKAPEERGRFKSFQLAVDAAFKDLLVERNDFFESLPEQWQQFFPNLPIRPGRYEGGVIYLYVKSAPLSFSMRPKLPMIKKKLATLAGAPKNLVLKLEIHS